MDDLVSSALRQPLGGPAARDVWDVCAPHLGAALARDLAGPLLESLEEVARNAALTGAREVEELLEAFAQGCLVVRRALAARGGDGAAEALARLTSLEHDGAARLAAGYAAGLEETIGRLRHRTEECSPEDPVSGVLRVSRTLELLDVEVDRCRRTALPLGILGLGLGDVAAGATATGAAFPSGDGPETLRAVAAALRANVRRYDVVGRTADGDFLVVVPDVSRRAFAGIAERLRREVGEGLGGRRQCVAVLAHYDYVDVGSAEMMAAVERRVVTARSGREPLVWA